jgi:hypothetical protein
LAGQVGQLPNQLCFSPQAGLACNHLCMPIIDRNIITTPTLTSILSVGGWGWIRTIMYRLSYRNYNSGPHFVGSCVKVYGKLSLMCVSKHPINRTLLPTHLHGCMSEADMGPGGTDTHIQGQYLAQGWGKTPRHRGRGRGGG